MEEEKASTLPMGKRGESNHITLYKKGVGSLFKEKALIFESAMSTVG